MLNELKKLETKYKKLSKIKESTKPLEKMKKFINSELTTRYNKKEFFEYFLDHSEELKSLNLPKIFKDLTVKKISNDEISGRDYTGHPFDPFHEMLVSEDLLNGLFEKSLSSKEMIVRTSSDFEEVIKKIAKKEVLESLIKENIVTFEIKGSYSFSSTVTIYKSMFDNKDWEELTDYSEHYETYIKHPDIGVNILQKEIANIIKKYYNKHILVYRATNGSLYELSLRG